MAWQLRRRIDSRWRFEAMLRALATLGIDFERTPCELILREEAAPIAGWRRRLFHACCADLAPHWGLTPGEVKTKVKEDFYGSEVRVPGGKLTPAELADFKRLLDKLGPYDVVVQSSEDSDDEEYARLVEHLYQMASESEVHLADRRAR